MLTTESLTCLLLIFLTNGLCSTLRPVFTTPGSYLQLNISSPEQRIICNFMSKELSSSEIVNTFGDYDTNKYKIRTSKILGIKFKAPDDFGAFGLSVSTKSSIQLNETDILATSHDGSKFGKKKSTIDLTFTDNSSSPYTRILSFTGIGSYFGQLEGTFDYYLTFHLRITNVSTTDAGNYECSNDLLSTVILVTSIRFLNQSDDNVISGYEGTTKNISCVSIKGQDVERLSIKENGTILATSKSNIVTFSLKPDREDNLKVYECYTINQTAMAYVTLHVNYAPNVTVILRGNSIDCLASDGFPDTYIFDKWEHQSEDGDHVRFVDGLQNGTLIMQTIPYQYQMSGRYVCALTNTIHDANGSMLQKSSEYFIYHGPPMFAKENRKLKFAELYKTITVTFFLFSNPMVEHIWIECVAPGYTKNETINDFNMTETNLKYTDFESNANIKGELIVFEFKMLSNEYEMYRIWASNALGEDSFSFNIEATGFRYWRRRRLYTTPGSYSQINLTDSQVFPRCKFISTETNPRSENITIDSHGKYQSRTILTIQAPQQIGLFGIESGGAQTRELDEKDISLKTDNEVYRMEGSTIDLAFTFIFSTWSKDEYARIYGSLEFQLRITNISITDIGNYSCNPYSYQTIQVSSIRLLNQNYYNTIIVHEGKSVNISCASVTGYDVGKISVKLNRIIVAESDSNIVTYSFIPDRQYNFKRLTCESDKMGPETSIDVHFIVQYAPDVTVVFGFDRIYCSPDGIPDTYTFNRWEHQSEQGEHIRFLDGLENGTLILQKLSQQYQISGRYVCTVSNGIPDIYGRNSQKGFISHNYEGPPKFVQENKNLKFVELYKPNAMAFLIYSNPVVEELWIEAVAPCYTKNETIHDFDISEIELLYSDFGNKRFIKGNEITFEFKILSTEYEMYKIWTKNKLGEDSFDFNIQAVEYDKKDKKDRTGLITSSSIATGLLIYIIVFHICLIIRHRINRTRQGHIQDPLHFHTYEDIDSISFAAANTRGLVTDQERPMLPTIITNSPHNESTINSISNRPTVNVSTSSIVSHQDSQVNAARCSYNVETEISTSSMFPIGEIRHSDGSYDEVSVASTDDSLQSFQRRSHQDENSSNVTSSVGLIVGDENENQYEIAIDDNK